MSLEMILENKRDEYLIQVLEEGTTELESLKTKKYLIENLNFIKKILVEEGLLDTLKNHGGKIAAGVGIGAAATYGMDHMDQVRETVGTGIEKAKEVYNDAKNSITDTETNQTDQTNQLQKDREYVRNLNLKNTNDVQSAIEAKKIHPENNAVKELNKSFDKPVSGPKRQGE